MVRAQQVDRMRLHVSRSPPWGHVEERGRKMKGFKEDSVGTTPDKSF